MSESIPLVPERDTDDEDARASAVDDEPGYDEVASRAYELFESGEVGTPKQHWERAERELREAEEPESV